MGDSLETAAEVGGRYDGENHDVRPYGRGRVVCPPKRGITPTGHRSAQLGQYRHDRDDALASTTGASTPAP